MTIFLTVLHVMVSIVLVVVVLLRGVVGPVVSAGHSPGFGLHTRVTVSLSFRGGLSVDLTATFSVQRPSRVPFFFVFTRTSTSVPQTAAPAQPAGWSSPSIRPS